MKEKKEKKEKETKNPYRKEIYSLMEKEKKDVAKEKLKEKGISVGEIGGYNVKKLKSAYRKEKVKEFAKKVSSNIVKGIDKYAKQKMVSKPILRKSKTTYQMPNRPVENIWNDKNRFFKGAIQDELI